MFKKLAAGGVGVLILVSPLVSSAQSTSAQAQIALLLQQISQLQAQITAIKAQQSLTDALNDPNHEALPCIVLKNTLTVGSTDALTAGEVSKLQTFLMGQGTVDDPIYPERLRTGYFGPATSRAVQKWQAAHGITVTTAGVAIVGPKTRAAMSALDPFCHTNIQTNSADLKTFTSSQYGFSVQYPSSLTPVASPYPFSLKTMGSNNIIEGELNIYANSGYSQSECTALPSAHEGEGGTVSNAGTVNINGVSFVAFTVSAVASGAAQDLNSTERWYKAYHGGMCYWIVESTHGHTNAISANPSNAQNDNAQLAAKLDPVVQSFRFTN